MCVGRMVHCVCVGRKAYHVATRNVSRTYAQRSSGVKCAARGACGGSVARVRMISVCKGMGVCVWQCACACVCVCAVCGVWCVVCVCVCVGYRNLKDPGRRMSLGLHCGEVQVWTCLGCHSPGGTMAAGPNYFIVEKLDS